MKVSAPGKTLLAGEYAVLLPGEPALVAAVDRLLSVSLRPASQWTVMGFFRASGRSSDRASEGSSGTSLDRSLGRSSEESSSKIFEKSPKRASERTSIRAPDRTPERTSGRTSKSTSEKTSGRTPERAAESVSERISDRVSEGKSDRTSKRTSNSTSDSTSSEGASGASNAASAGVLDTVSARISGRSSEVASERGPRSSSRTEGFSEIRWTEGEAAPAELKFVITTLELARQRWALSPQELSCSGAFEFQGRKLGLGGSSAIVAATAVALGRLASASPEEVSELAQQAHRKAQQGKGSGADVAASLHGQVVCYRQNMAVQGLCVHQDIRLLLAFSGESVKTGPRVALFEQARREKHLDITRFAQSSREAVDEMAKSLVQGDIERLREAVTLSRRALGLIEPLLGVEIETNALKAAADAAFLAGGAGKSSGAGGGDCAVLFAAGDDMAGRVRRKVEALGLWVMDAPIARKGALDALDG